MSGVGEALEGEMVEDGPHQLISVDGLAFTHNRGDGIDELVAGVGVQGARSDDRGAILLALNDAAEEGGTEVTSQGLFHAGAQSFIAKALGHGPKEVVIGVPASLSRQSLAEGGKPGVGIQTIGFWPVGSGTGN